MPNIRCFSALLVWYNRGIWQRFASDFMPTAKTPTVSIVLDSAERLVRLAEMRQLCEKLAACLDQIATTTLPGKPPEFAIVQLINGSAGLQVAPDRITPDEGAKVLSEFKHISRVLHFDEANGHIDSCTLERFRSLAGFVAKRNNRLWFDNLEITTQFIANIDKRLSTPIRSFGNLKGRLDKIDVHGKNQFVIYPPIRTRGIKCQFAESLTEQVGLAVKKSVTVTGLTHYHDDEPFPYFVEVETITIHPPNEELPSLRDMKGVAPDLTGADSTIDYLRSLVNE